MGALREKLRHAFAVDPPGPAEPTPEQRAVVDAFCRQIAKRRLTTPGLIALEVSRPLNWLGAQLMHVFSPAVWAVTPERTHEKYRHLAAFLEHRGAVEYLCRRIEEIEREFEAVERAARESERQPPEP